MHYIYIVRCVDGTLYTGYSTNIEQRIRKHNGEISGGAKYTAARAPVKLVYSQSFKSKSKAMKREAEVKKLTKKEKETLVSASN